MNYKLIANSTSIIRLSDGGIIPDNPALAAWQDYQDWLKDGNVPEPADDPTQTRVSDWVGFAAVFLQDPDWEHRKLDLPEEIRIGVLSTASNRNLAGLAYWYGLAKQFWGMNGKSLPDSVRDRWQKVAIAHNIDFTF